MPLPPTPKREGFKPTDAEFLGEFLRRVVQSLLFASTLLVGMLPSQALFPASDPMDAYGPAAQIWLPLVHAISFTSIMSLFVWLDDGSRLRLLLAGCCATIAAIIGDIAAGSGLPSVDPVEGVRSRRRKGGRRRSIRDRGPGVVGGVRPDHHHRVGIRRFVPDPPAGPASNDEPRSS